MTVSMLLLMVAVAVGTAGEWLLVDQPAGVNVLVFAALVCGGACLIARRCERRSASWVTGLWASAVVFALAGACYDAEMVQAWAPALCGLMLLLALAWSFAGAVSLDRFSVPVPVSLALNVLVSPVYACLGLRAAGGGATCRILDRRLLTGVALSLPLLAAFTSLFCMSDPVFERNVNAVLEGVSVDVVASFVRVALFSALAFGLLHRLLLHAHAPQTLTSSLCVDPVVVSVALSLVNGLFAAFLVIQARYLFAGNAVLSVPGLTCADYARRGFFELEAATVLVLIIVVMVHAVLHAAHGRTAARALSALLAVQTLGIAASAAKRMALYTDAYGLTVLRFYASAGIAVICVLLLVTIVGNGLDRTLAWLASRVFVVALVGVALVSLVDVEGMVACVNLARAERVDVRYLASLSADVVPALEAGCASGDPAVAVLAREALALWRVTHVGTPHDWRSYNLSRARVRDSILVPPHARATGDAGRIVQAGGQTSRERRYF